MKTILFCLQVGTIVNADGDTFSGTLNKNEIQWSNGHFTVLEATPHAKSLSFDHFVDKNAITY